MERHSVEVLGIILTFSKRLGRLKIQYVLRLKRKDGTRYVTIQGATDKTTAFSFSNVVHAVNCLYEEQIVNIWIRETVYIKARYYQLVRLASPRFTGLKGRWQRWAQE